MASRFLSRLLRLSRQIEICWEILTIWRLFELENDKKSWCIEKSWQKYTKINLLLNRDWDKLSRIEKNYWSRQTSWSQSRLFGLDIDVEMELRSLDLDQDFLTVETHFLTMSRLRLLIETRSRQIKTPRLKRITLNSFHKVNFNMLKFKAHLWGRTIEFSLLAFLKRF